MLYSANKPARKTSWSRLPKKVGNRSVTSGDKKTPVWTWGHVFDAWRRAKTACQGTSTVGQLLMCALDWALTVTKPIQWPMIAAWWGLASQWCWPDSMNKKLKYFTIKRDSIILFHGTLCVISPLKNDFCCAKRPTRNVIVHSGLLQVSKFTE